jgi:polysaccharide export outer membrane protein
MTGARKMITKKVSLFMIIILLASSAAWADQEAGDYLIGPGDVLDISVWKDETLTRSVVVLADGKISFPLIGEVIAEGKTVAQLKKEIEGKLAPFVPDTTLSLEVKQVNSMLVYVIGRVNSPGRFALNANVNVLQALSIAGGFNPFAKRDKIKVFRQEGDKTHIFNFQYDSVVKGKNLEQNIMLKRGDVVVVP